MPSKIRLGTSLLITSLAALAEQRMVSIGNHRLSIDCEGPAGSPTVVLIAGGGRTSQDWRQVQSGVAKFARVCSYDFAGFGQSDKAPSQTQTLIQAAAEVVEDLHRLLEVSGEKMPFILVGHSVAGIYSRSFVSRNPHQVAGLVFVDSAHEEQALRFHQFDPNWQALDEESARWGLYVEQGKRSSGGQNFH